MGSPQSSVSGGVTRLAMLMSEVSAFGRAGAKDQLPTGLISASKTAGAAVFKVITLATDRGDIGD